ncbi:MAG: hypothetical protein F6K65_04930 [Moorea sp. SIO3C2]|nr:hypothetical protein [Moorena sp. SIO3C2]
MGRWGDGEMGRWGDDQLQWKLLRPRCINTKSPGLISLGVLQELIIMN